MCRWNMVNGLAPHFMKIAICCSFSNTEKIGFGSIVTVAEQVGNCFINGCVIIFHSQPTEMSNKNKYNDVMNIGVCIFSLIIGQFNIFHSRKLPLKCILRKQCLLYYKYLCINTCGNTYIYFNFKCQ